MSIIESPAPTLIGLGGVEIRGRSRSQDLHLALPKPEVAPPEFVVAELRVAMLSLAASCARLGFPCLATAGIGGCIVGNPLGFG